MDVVQAKKMISKKYGEGSIMTLSGGKITGIQPICSSGSYGIDQAMGIGGYPKERIVEIYGPEASGKTTLALHAIAEIQKAGGTAAFIDVEHALDVKYAKALGVDIPNLLISQPDYGEQAADLAVDLLRFQRTDPKKPLLIIVDSVDALIPKREIDGDFDKETKAKAAKKKAEETGEVVQAPSKGAGMGARARIMGSFCRQITANLKGSNTTFIFINQIRMKIGIMFGNPETTSGGNALKFYASIRMDIRNLGLLKEHDIVIGNKYRVKIKKNKVAVPFQEHEGRIIHGFGIDKEYELFNALKDGGHTDKAGSWYTIPAFKDCKFQGFNGFKELIKEESIEKQLIGLLPNVINVDKK